MRLIGKIPNPPISFLLHITSWLLICCCCDFINTTQTKGMYVSQGVGKMELKVACSCVFLQATLKYSSVMLMPVV